MFNIKSIFENRAYYFILVALINSVIGFALTPIYTRILSVADYGVFAVYQVWVSVISLVVGFNIQAAIPNTIVDYGIDGFKVRIWSYARFILYFGLVFIVLIFLLNSSLPSIIKGTSSQMTIFLVVNTVGMALFSFVTVFFVHTGKGRDLFNVTLVVLFLLHIIGIVSIVNIQSEKYMGRVYAQALTYGMFIVYFWIKFVRRGGRIYSNHIYYALPISIPLIIHLISNQVLGQIDRVILGSYLDSSSVAIYSIAYTIGSISLLLAEGFQNLWTPWYFDKLSIDKYDVIEAQSSRYTSFIVVVGIFIIVSSDFILTIFAPVEYSVASDLVSVIVLGTFFLFLYRFPLGYLHFSKRTIFIPMVTISVALLNVALNVLFIKSHGMFGAAFSTLLCYLLLYVFTELVARFLVGGFIVRPWAYLKFAPILIIFALFDYVMPNLMVFKIIIFLSVLFFHINRYEDLIISKLFRN